MRNRIMPRLHPVFIHYHNNSRQIARQHIRLVAGVLGVEQNFMPVGHYFWRRRLPVRNPSCKPRKHAFRFALVPAAQYRNLPSALRKRPRKFLDYRRFSGAAHCEISDDHHRATQREVAQYPGVVHLMPQPYYSGKNERQPFQKGGINPYPETVAAVVYDVGGHMHKIFGVAF